MIDEETGERQVDRVIKQREAVGHEIPDRYFDPLLPEAEFYMRAWYALAADRPPGFGFAPIPWTAIYFYATAHGELANLDTLTQMIWALDNKQARVEQDKRDIEERRNGRSRNQDSSRFVGGSTGQPGNRGAAR